MGKRPDKGLGELIFEKMKMIKEEFKIKEKSCIGYINPEAKALLIQPVDEHNMEVLDAEAAGITAQAEIPFSLVAFEIKDWNRELSPWQAPAVFGNESFGDGAAETLLFIEAELLPDLFNRYGLDTNLPVILGGYSLAGLFSLWSGYNTKRFTAISAASPSVWLEKWRSYVNENNPMTDIIYLSLGNKEERNRNKVMSTVGDCIRKQYSLLKSYGTDCTLEWNEGNHFQDSEKRCVKGFAWCIKEISKRSLA